MKKEPQTAAELLKELESDPQWRERREHQKKILQQKEAEYRHAEIPIVQELNSVGIRIRSVWDLVNTPRTPAAAIPVLLKHLVKPYPERVREGIARALAVPEANYGWPILLNAFRHEKDNTTIGPKWAIAVALGATGNDDVLDEVIELVSDKSLGENRVPLLQVLCRSHNPRAFQLLEKLKDDQEIGRDARLALRKFRSQDRRS
jgi:HEAT repeat protein